MRTPLVSVLICTYNAEHFIESTLSSVLNQTYKNIEVLILDNGSHDKTVQKIQGLALSVNSKSTASVDYRSIHLIQGKNNIGPYKGLNLLLGKASGEFIAINDHDDIWHAEKLEKQVKFLESNTEYIGCGTAIINWYEKYNRKIYRSQPVKSDIAWHTSLVFRNKNYRYDTSVKVGTDFYFMKNILSENKKSIYNFQAPYVFRRIFARGQNLSGQWMKRQSLIYILKLKVGLLDKLALLYRYLLPQIWVEWLLVKLFSGNVPKKYVNYFNTDLPPSF